MLHTRLFDDTPNPYSPLTNVGRLNERQTQIFLCYIPSVAPKLSNAVMHQSHSSFADINLEALLYDKEGRVCLERSAGMNQLEPVISQQPRDDLVDLEQRQVPADTEMTSAAKLEMAIGTDGQHSRRDNLPQPGSGTKRSSSIIIDIPETCTDPSPWPSPHPPTTARGGTRRRPPQTPSYPCAAPSR